MGNNDQLRMKGEEVLKYFAKRKGIEKGKYREFVSNGVKTGKRLEVNNVMAYLFPRFPQLLQI